MAPLIAPQLVWPTTTMIFVPHQDGVLEAAELVVVHDVARHAQREDVTDALIEDDLHGRPRIHASEDRCERVLSRRGGHDLGRPVALLRCVRGEASVPLLQSLECLGRRHRRLRLPRLHLGSVGRGGVLGGGGDREDG